MYYFFTSKVNTNSTLNTWMCDASMYMTNQIIYNIFVFVSILLYINGLNWARCPDLSIRTSNLNSLDMNWIASYTILNYNTKNLGKIKD